MGWWGCLDTGAEEGAGNVLALLLQGGGTPILAPELPAGETQIFHLLYTKITVQSFLCPKLPLLPTVLILGTSQLIASTQSQHTNHSK